MTFELNAGNAAAYLADRGLASLDPAIVAEELQGGVSAAVIAVRSPASGLAVVVKQALPQLRVSDEWLATQRRTETEAAAMRLCGSLTPGSVPRVLDADPDEHVMVMELLPDDARNWQAEIAAGRTHSADGRWAGATLGRWHGATAGSREVSLAFDDFDAFEQLRLHPFLETLMERRPELADEIAPRLGELRAERRCLVHGDYAKKNMLVGPSGRWVLDFEVAHYGNPVFDLAFFLSFVVLSCVRWPGLADELEELGAYFLSAYHAAVGDGFAGDPASVTAHTACLILARTDGKSPAQFLDPPSRARAREAGIALLQRPERGLWSWR